MEMKGWSKEFPTEEGYYWWVEIFDNKEVHHSPTIVLLHEGKLYYIGDERLQSRKQLDEMTRFNQSEVFFWYPKFDLPAEGPYNTVLKPGVWGS